MGIESFDDFAAAAWPRLIRTARLLGSSHDDAQDLAQIALTKCLVQWPRVSTAQNPEAYLHKILLNTYRSSRRRRWNLEIPTDSMPDWQGGPAARFDDDLRGSVRRVLGTLPHDQRVVLVLRFYLDYSERQMAELLGVAPGTVKSRISRALTALSTDPRVLELKES